MYKVRVLNYFMRLFSIIWIQRDWQNSHIFLNQNQQHSGSYQKDMAYTYCVNDLIYTQCEIVWKIMSSLLSNRNCSSIQIFRISMFNKNIFSCTSIHNKIINQIRTAINLSMVLRAGGTGKPPFGCIYIAISIIFISENLSLLIWLRSVAFLHWC